MPRVSHSGRLAAVVLAAGYGTRLRPLTDLRPKPLCPVNDVPLIDHALARAEAVTASIAVNVHHHRDMLVEHLDGRAHLSIEEPAPLGTAGALGALRGWIDGRDVLVVNADAWGAADLASWAEDWDGTRIRMLTVQDPARGDFGDLRYAGACLLPWTLVRDLRPEPSGLYATLWGEHAARGELDLIASDAPFFDCGTPRDYLAANLAASGGRSVIGRGAVVRGTVERSVVWPGATVREDEHLVGCIRARDDVTVRAE